MKTIRVEGELWIFSLGKNLSPTGFCEIVCGDSERKLDFWACYVFLHVVTKFS